MSALVLQAMCKPSIEDFDALKLAPNIEVTTNEDSEIVRMFRMEIDLWFNRYQNFYDRAGVSMHRLFRLSHVTLITTIYNRLMTVFGNDVEAIRQSSWELSDLIAERREILGENNACLNGIVVRQGPNSGQVSSTIQSCALYANTTMSRLLTSNFYPVFANMQNTLSGLNVAVVDALSRGNVLQDELAIIEYLRLGYEVAEFQWISSSGRLLQWERNRFQVDGLFLVDEMSICTASAVIQFLITNSQLQVDAFACT